MGIQLSFEPGPVISEPIRTDAQIEALPELVAARDVPFVLETIRLVRAAAPRGTPLIGFAGAPFTLLCYLVCGRPSKEFAAARTFLYAQPESAQRLLERLADAMAEYLAAQAAAGAQALMLFESWAGLLGVREFTGFALAAVQRTAAALRRLSVPLIYYVNQGSDLMSAVAPLDVDVIGIAYFRDLQARLCGAFEAFEPVSRFESRSWTKPAGHRLQGGGEARLMRGAVFEKVGVNVSHVWGVLAPEARGQVAGAKESDGR